MISNKLITEHAKKCKQFISNRLGHPSKASLKDLELLIRCKANTNFSPMFTTTVYNRIREEYPLALIYLDDLSEHDLNGTSPSIVNIKFTLHKYEKINNRWKLINESCAVLDSASLQTYIENNTGKTKLKDGAKRSVKYDNTRFDKQVVEVTEVRNWGTRLVKSVGSINYSEAREYYPQQNTVKKRGGHQYV